MDDDEDGELIAEGGETKGEPRQGGRRARGYPSDGPADGKEVERRLSGALEGKAISGPQLKTNTCLLTPPLSWLVKSRWNDVCIGTLPLPHSVSPSEKKQNKTKSRGPDGE